MNKLSFLIVLFSSLGNLFSQHRYTPIDWKHPEVGQALLMPVHFTQGGRLEPSSILYLDSLARKLQNIDSFIFSVESYAGCIALNNIHPEQSRLKADSIVAYLDRKTYEYNFYKKNGSFIGRGFGTDSMMYPCKCEGRKKSRCKQSQYEQNQRCVIRILRKHPFRFFSWAVPHIGWFEVVPRFPSCSPRDIEQYIVLNEMCEELLYIDTFSFTLEIHSDCRSSSEYNKQHTQRVADSSLAFINRKYGNRLQIQAVGYGEDSLVNDCPCEGSIKKPCSEEQHQKNRRMVLRITGKRNE